LAVSTPTTAALGFKYIGNYQSDIYNHGCQSQWNLLPHKHDNREQQEKKPYVYYGWNCICWRTNRKSGNNKS
ncbi:MAG: hypothetical protein JTJ12_06490, partial [Eubacterium sp.]|nr:hypothetical protein [Eubacterium sp.]